jgi:hypothetical protein
MQITATDGLQHLYTTDYERHAMDTDTYERDSSDADNTSKLIAARESLRQQNKRAVGCEYIREAAGGNVCELGSKYLRAMGSRYG